MLCSLPPPLRLGSSVPDHRLRLSRSECTHLGLSVVSAAAPVRMFVPFHLNGTQHRALPTGNSSTRPHTRRENTTVLRWSRPAPAPLDPGLTHRWSARESERPGHRVWGGGEGGTPAAAATAAAGSSSQSAG